MGIAFDAFSHYVPKKIVRKLIDTNQMARVSGERFFLTLLFTDIKDFTVFSDSKDATQFTFLLVGIWWILFSQLTIYFIPEKSNKIILSKKILKVQRDILKD